MENLKGKVIEAIKQVVPEAILTEHNIPDTLDDFMFSTKDGETYRTIASDVVWPKMEGEVVWDLEYIGKSDPALLASLLETSKESIENIQQIGEFKFLGWMIIKAYKLSEYCIEIGLGAWFGDGGEMRTDIIEDNFLYYVFRQKK